MNLAISNRNRLYLQVQVIWYIQVILRNKISFPQVMDRDTKKIFLSFHFYVSLASIANLG